MLSGASESKLHFLHTYMKYTATNKSILFINLRREQSIAI